MRQKLRLIIWCNPNQHKSIDIDIDMATTTTTTTSHFVRAVDGWNGGDVHVYVNMCPRGRDQGKLSHVITARIGNKQFNALCTTAEAGEMCRYGRQLRMEYIPKGVFTDRDQLCVQWPATATPIRGLRGPPFAGKRRGRVDMDRMHTMHTLWETRILNRGDI